MRIFPPPLAADKDFLDNAEEASRLTLYPILGGASAEKCPLFDIGQNLIVDIGTNQIYIYAVGIYDGVFLFLGTPPA